MMIAVEDIAIGAADDDRGGGRSTEQREGAGADDRRGHQHLGAAHAEHFPAHREQARQGEFESEREHQEHHAEIRQQARRVVVHRPGEGMRTEQHADREIADDRRQCEPARAGDDADRGGEQDQDLEQRAAVHSRCPTDCGAC